MTSMQFHRLSGLGIVIGAFFYVIYLVARSFLTAGVDPAASATLPLWAPVNLLGALGATLVLLGLPVLYGQMAETTGRLGLVGIGLIALAWLFFGVFLSLYGALIQPWLAEQAPSLVAADAPTPPTFVAAFIIALLSWLVGTVLLAIPFFSGRKQPRWVGYLLPVSALWLIISDFVIAPNGPAANLVVNILSNLGPALLLIPIGYWGARMWRAT